MIKKIVQSVIIAFVIVFSISLEAQTKTPKLENSLLWEVTGKGLVKPSYLYGTIHMICSKDYFLNEKTTKAFEVSDKLVLEINISDPSEMANVQQMAMGKEPLSKTLKPEDTKRLDSILQKKVGIGIQQVDAFSLFTVMSLASMKTFGCQDLKFYEMNFIEMAQKKSIPIIGLEKVKEQLDFFAKGYTDSEMITMIAESNEQETAKLVAKYKEENINSLYELATDQKYTSKETKKIILDDRNSSWVKIMPELMQKESVFFAVGAAHLAGELGVINLLKKAGYTVKPIMN